MGIAEIIRQAREALGMTQEDLAEKLEVSRQAVSKWELGASVPSPENLKILEEVLEVQFPAPEEPASQTAAKAGFWNWERVVLLILGVLMLIALFSGVLFLALRDTSTAVPQSPDPQVTEVAFFDQNAAPLQPDLGDGWNRFTAGERVLTVVRFRNGTEQPADAVSLFLTPTGTETFDLREQVAVQAVYDGRDFALLAWEVPDGQSWHLGIVLECGEKRVEEILNLTVPTLPEDEPRGNLESERIPPSYESRKIE